jgi:hypothetical protein
MNTMIPNKLRFDLDLHDLPARASQVESEALSISGRGNCQNYFTDLPTSFFQGKTNQDKCRDDACPNSFFGPLTYCGKAGVDKGKLVCLCKRG